MTRGSNNTIAGEFAVQFDVLPKNLNKESTKGKKSGAGGRIYRSPKATDAPSHPDPLSPEAAQYIQRAETVTHKHAHNFPSGWMLPAIRYTHHLTRHYNTSGENEIT